MYSNESIEKINTNESFIMELTEDELDSVVASNSINEMGKWVGYEARQSTMNKDLFRMY